MSEFDSLSDSDWLDIASRASDDNDSVSSHEGLSSRPLSRRSSISFGSSHESEVEAWEGFVDESGDESNVEHGMCLVRPLRTTSPSESLPTGTIPDITHDSNDDKQVREALDQSMVGTLSASRTSTAGHSAHSSIRDLRLSFPDPLTSSRDQLTKSYTEVPDSESLSTSNDADVATTLADSLVSSYECEPEVSSTVSHAPHHEVTQQDNKPSNLVLDIILYGSSSPIKWSFAQNFIQKAAYVSGNVVLNTLDPNTGPMQTLELRCGNDNSIPTSINVYDSTNDSPGTADALDLQDDVIRPSLAIVYLPATTLPVLSLHTAYLPVLVPAAPDSKDSDIGSVLRHVAEDDWDLLGVSADKTVILDSEKSPVFVADALSRIEPWKVSETIDNILDCRLRRVKAVPDNGHSVRAVTLVALVSVMVGLAFNSAFRGPVSVPTGTINESTWATFQSNPINRTLAVPVTSATLSASSSKDISLDVLSSGITSLSIYPPRVGSPPVTSRDNSLSSSVHATSVYVIPTSTSLAIRGPSCKHLSASDEALASRSEGMTDRAVASASLSESRLDASSPVSICKGKHHKADSSPSNSISVRFPNSLSEVIDVGAKLVGNTVKFENGVKDLIDAFDDLIASIQTQIQEHIRKYKGKARELQDVAVSRNGKATRRAKEIKKQGSNWLVKQATAGNEWLGGRNAIATERAKGLKEGVKQGIRHLGAYKYKSYEKVLAAWVATLKGVEQCAKDKPGWPDREEKDDWSVWVAAACGSW